VVWDLEPSCGNLVEEVWGRGPRSTYGKVEHQLNEFWGGGGGGKKCRGNAPELKR
jgi:hypothetical protein